MRNLRRGAIRTIARELIFVVPIAVGTAFDTLRQAAKQPPYYKRLLEGAHDLRLFALFLLESDDPKVEAAFRPPPVESKGNAPSVELDLDD